ncbi:MAG: FCD domain-containing protein [Rhodobacteraceae bacterium]|nr:FCD domain-containing protein [Paracoccaceae bacterium]
MPFQKIVSEKLSSAVVRQIELLILRGVLRPGERLPAERELADRLGVSRPSLREALAELQQAGLVSTRPGAGVFVAEVLGSAFSPALVRLFRSHEDAIFDYIDFRRDLESMSAERAATLGTGTDLKVIDTLFHKMEAAHSKRDPTDEAQLDAQFHLAIVEASHNIVRLHMMRSMFELLADGVFYNRQAMFRQRATRDQLLEQHRAINNALQARDPEAARDAAAAHLDFVESTLRSEGRARSHEELARQRYHHELET